MDQSSKPAAEAFWDRDGCQEKLAVFTLNGFEVSAVQSSEDALMLLKKDEFALVLLDFKMPNINGDSVLRMIREINPLQQVAMYSCDYSRDSLKP